MAGRVLLTGGSSFTGVWIAEALAAAGFAVTATLLRPRDAYDGVRLARVARLEQCAEVLFERPFASLADLPGRFDVLAHHAAHITGYRDPAFDAVDALRRNTDGAEAVLRAFRAAGGQAVMLTGSVFEAGEGGEARSLAVTPYGLSKTLTSATFAFWTAEAGLRSGRFVIPSPYGPLEEPRFGWHLFRNWFADETPVVKTPRYVRDHIAAPQVASAYVRAVRAILDGGTGEVVARPSGWIATQGDFAQRVASEARARLGLECRVELAEQTHLAEPLTRVNSEPTPFPAEAEAAFWDQYVAWYAELDAGGRLA